MPLETVVEGDAARQLVRRLHVGAATVPQDTLVAEYGYRGTVLYLSRFASPEQARGALEAMLAAIRAGRGPFSRPEAVNDGSWAMSGLGLAHRLWVRGSRLVWLQAPPDAIEAAVRDLGRYGPG